MFLAVGATSLLISSCASEPITVPTPGDTKVIPEVVKSDPKLFNSALAEAIEKSDKIVIKEHSHKVDFFGTPAEEANPPTYTYARKELTPGEKILFLENVRNLKGEEVTEHTLCMFVPHHTIDFYEGGQLKNSMKVCYKCNEVKWNGTAHDASKDVFKALSPAISRAGMHTHRAWDALAKQRYEEETQSNRVDADKPNVAPQGPPTAKWAVGKKGKRVINPFTGKEVDVEGIPARTKVKDPNDKDPSHVFRVPEL